MVDSNHNNGVKTAIPGGPPASASRRRAAHQIFWRHQMAGAAAETILIPDHQNSSMESDWRHCTVALPESLNGPVRSLTMDRPLSSFIVFLGGIQTLLLRYFDQREITVWIPAHPAAKLAAAPFLPLRSRLREDDTWRLFLSRLRGRVVGA